MKLFSYVITRDHGFAPNPFGGCCTLATCKPLLRKQAQPGDWVIGTGSKVAGLKGRLIYVMRVDEKLTFDEYWNDPRFVAKKSVFNSGLKHCFGDNVYHHDPATGEWLQEDSHHSLEGGGINITNLETDTRWPYVLVSYHYRYFGSNHVALPEEWIDALCNNRRVPPHLIVEDNALIEALIGWVNARPERKGAPMEFQKGFVRYRG